MSDVRSLLGDARDGIDALADNVDAIREIAALADAVATALTAGHRVFLFGNGGSAADAQHIAAEFVGRFRRERRALPAEALTVNGSVLTAIGNDYGFEQIFARQIEAQGRPGDIAIGLSTSGASSNVLTGLRAARSIGLHTALLTGSGGSAERDAAAQCILVPSDVTARIQECHTVIGHVLCELVDQALVGEPR